MHYLHSTSWYWRFVDEERAQWPDRQSRLSLDTGVFHLCWFHIHLVYAYKIGLFCCVVVCSEIYILKVWHSFKHFMRVCSNRLKMTNFAHVWARKRPIRLCIQTVYSGPSLFAWRKAPSSEFTDPEYLDTSTPCPILIFTRTFCWYIKNRWVSGKQGRPRSEDAYYLSIWFGLLNLLRSGSPNCFIA